MEARNRCSTILFATLLLYPWAGPTARGADEFRVETDLLLGSEKKPFARNLTIFTEGLVYDFPVVGPNEITVFDADRGRFVILDVDRKMKTTVTSQRLLEYAAAIRARSGELQGAFAFAANPSFQEAFADDGRTLTLTSDFLIYRATLAEPQVGDASQQFQRFADWYARLNATRPGNLPPFARIALDKAIADRGLIPTEIELTILPTNRLLGKRLEMRSRHLFNWRISNTDRKRISQAGDYMANFQAVSPDEYHKNLAIVAAK